MKTKSFNNKPNRLSRFLITFFMLSTATSFGATIALSMGTLNVTGDGDTGWVRTGSSGSGASNNSPDGDSYWGEAAATHTGTSNGDTLVAGSYTVSFLSAFTAGLDPEFFTIEAFAWDGSTETSLGVPTTVNVAPPQNWITNTHTFSIASGDAAIGQDIRLKFNGSNNGGQFWGFDSVTVSYDTIPEPSSSVLLGLGLSSLILRRRK